MFVNKIIITFAVLNKNIETMKQGFTLRLDLKEKYGFTSNTLILVSLLVATLEKGDGWLKMRQDDIAEMLGMSSVRVNQIFRKLKSGGFVTQKKDGGDFNNRRAYKFNEEKLK